MVVTIKEIETSQLLQDDAYKAFNIEVQALSECRNLEHGDMTPCLAAILKKFRVHALLHIPNGGCLRDFWKKMTNLSLSQTVIRDIFEQLHSLAGALVEALQHYSGQEASFPRGANLETIYNRSGDIRHGDSNPENILIFKASNESQWSKIGTLKISQLL